MIDEQGYRPNVGIVLCNRVGQVLWARRSHRDGWQFPQGGIKEDETPEQALFRELREEIGLAQPAVQVLGRTRDWVRYEIPAQYRRSASQPCGHDVSGVAARTFRGQKQIWFLLRLVGRDEDVRLDLAKKPEFDSWRWIEYWSALEHIVDFKRDVYRQALTELEPFLGRPNPP